MADTTTVRPPFTLPEHPQASRRYRDQFNAVAAEKKLGFSWAIDTKDPLVINAYEIQIAPEAFQKYNVQSATVTTLNPLLAKDIRTVLDEVETQRLARVEKSALAHKRIIFRGPTKLLGPVEQKAVALFAEKVGPILDRIESIQQDPNSPAHAKYVQRFGDYYSKILFSRFNRDTCAGFDAFDPACSILPFFPDHPAINGMIAADISMAQFQELGQKLPNTAEELRPSTVLTRAADGHIQATPLPQYAPVKDDHRKLAAALIEIANLRDGQSQLNPKLQNQLRKWAKFFQTGTAADEKAAVQATIDAGEVDSGLLRVHVGPSESYWDDNTKFPYVLQVGVRDPEVIKGFKTIAKLFPQLEQTAIPHYQPRSLSTRGGFADPMYHVFTAGFVRTFAVTEPAGNNFPNYNYGTEGSNRFIWLESLKTSATKMSKAWSDVMDVPMGNDDYVKIMIEFVINHESGHLLGPQRDHITPSGKKMGAIFGEQWGSADEPKADLTSAAIIDLQLKAKETTWEAAAPRLQALLLSSFLRFRKSKADFLKGKIRDHFYSAMLIPSYLFKQGALTLVDTPQGKRIHWEPQKALDAALELRTKIMTFQAAGDVDGYLAFGRETVAALPDAAEKLMKDMATQFPLAFIERHL